MKEKIMTDTVESNEDIMLYQYEKGKIYFLEQLREYHVKGAEDVVSTNQKLLKLAEDPAIRPGLTI